MPGHPGSSREHSLAAAGMTTASLELCAPLLHSGGLCCVIPEPPWQRPGTAPPADPT